MELSGAIGAGRRRPLATAPLAVLAALSVGTWLAVERLSSPLHPRHRAMVEAAGAMQAASRAIAREKERLGLLTGPELDPNRTGLIGPEFSDITTTMGLLEAKRTAANPDLAAALVRVFDGLSLRPGDRVALSLSGSFVGANLAALAAVRALGLDPVIVSSLGASMFGATDPELNWLEMEAVIRDRGGLAVRTTIAVLGGEGGLGRGIGEAGVQALRASAARHGVPIAQAEDFPRLVARVLAELNPKAGRGAKALINVGGSDLALGTCHDADRLPVGLSRTPLSCAGGTPGLVVEFSRLGVPVLHVLNMRRLALEWGLPFDPVPLPEIGNNPRIYGRAGLIGG